MDVDPAEIGKNRTRADPDRRRAGAGRAEAGARRSSRADGGPPAAPPEWLAEVRGWKREHPFRYRRAEPLKPEYVIERLRDLTARPRRDLDDRRRPAPDVGGAVPRDRPAAALASPRAGSGTMGFGVPAAIGAKLGRPGRDRDQHRRRRLLPDDDAGAGHRQRCTASAPSTWSSTTAGWAWCASGRSCSTTSASPRRCSSRPARLRASWPRPSDAPAFRCETPRRGRRGRSWRAGGGRPAA